jgi:hypothetical protein
MGSCSLGVIFQPPFILPTKCGHIHVLVIELVRKLRSLRRAPKVGLRRAAMVKAAKLLGSIVREGTVKLSKATVKASTMKLSQALRVVTGRRGKVKTL